MFKTRLSSKTALVVLLLGVLALSFQSRAKFTSDRNVALQFVNEYSPLDTDQEISELEQNSLDSTPVFAFYYPWYATPNVSGYWFHWDEGGHDPNSFLNGRRDIGAKDYPLLDVYDCNNESLIEKHIEFAKMANIDCFVASWWGIGSFEDNALSHIRNACEKNNFKFSVYYETTSGSDGSINDIIYILDTYSKSSAWYKIDNRPLIFVYDRARNQLEPQMYWDVDGNVVGWLPYEEVRESPRSGIFVIEPHKDGKGYVESEWISLPSTETYHLKVGVSDIRNDCHPVSDVGFRIRIKGEATSWRTLDNLIVNFNDGWLDLDYDISYYAGQNVKVRVESYDGGNAKWCSEWAGIDYFFIENSQGEVLTKGSHFDNEWKTVVENLANLGYNPYLIMDFGEYEFLVEDFAEYFLAFTDGLHIYNPISFSMPEIQDIYSIVSEIATLKDKFFVATVVPGYDETAIRSPGYVVDRENGACYKRFWSAAKKCAPDGFIITSFNEWHEGSEIEPSLEYGYEYVNLTKLLSTSWTVDDDGPADFDIIQKAINNVDDGDAIYVHNGTYVENVIVNRTVLLVGEGKCSTIVDGNERDHVILVTKDNVTITGFTVKGSNLSRIEDVYTGIYLYSVAYCNISGNILTNNSVGLMLAYSEHNTMARNNIVDNWGGITLTWNCDHNTIFENIITGCKEWASIYVDMSEHNIISRNRIANNTARGVFLRRARNNIILENNITNNYGGINPSGISIEEQSHCNNVFGNYLILNTNGVRLLSSYNNTISGNNITDNIDLGILVRESDHNTLSNNRLENNWIAVDVREFSGHNSICENEITGNRWMGIILIQYAHSNILYDNHIANNNQSGITIEDWSSNNKVVGNDIVENINYGIQLKYSSNNTFHLNNVIGNNQQVSILGDESTNSWDNHVEGNYWSNYIGIDSDYNGVGDVWFELDSNNIDHYPLMGTFVNFNTTSGKHVNVISNSTIEDFSYSESNGTIRMHVSGESGIGFCRISIPHGFMNTEEISVIIDDGLTPVLYHNYTLYDNGTHRWIYFAYEHTTHKIDIIPEFPLSLILPLLMIFTLVAVVLSKKKKHYLNKNNPHSTNSLLCN